MSAIKPVHVSFKEMPEIRKDKREDIIILLASSIAQDKTFSIIRTTDGITFYVPEEKYELKWEGTD